MLNIYEQTKSEFNDDWGLYWNRCGFKLKIYQYVKNFQH